MADEVGDQVKIVSGICCEGSFEAIEHAKAAKEAGADAILLDAGTPLAALWPHLE